ncbi:MAG: reverse transcriptase domain-containing protein [Burkholderiales bacterium]
MQQMFPELKDSVDNIKRKADTLSTPKDVATLLEIDYEVLNYHLFRISNDKKYTTFYIPKKSGGQRQITAPITSLKIIQQKLHYILQLYYQPRPSAHGFVRERSILTNAREHVGKRYVLNLDLADFFPSINLGRVRGLFMSKPFNFNAKVATVLAQICCYEGRLPQGAPTSPIVSNMICAKMDGQLQRLAQKLRCTYTRYVDDITFSTSVPRFPVGLAKIASEMTGQIIIGDELESIIKSNDFRINEKKVRLQTKEQRQEVTGLTTNKFPNVKRRYIRQIRAMLYAWDKHGLDAAEREFQLKYDKKHRLPRSSGQPGISYKLVVKGKLDFLGMVIGKTNFIYLRFRNQLKELAPDLINDSVTVGPQCLSVPLLITEGKTDYKHLKAALVWFQERGQFKNLAFDFKDFEAEVRSGITEVEGACTHLSKVPQHRRIIGIIDRDIKASLKTMTANGKEYKDWGNNVFSLALPVPEHRKDTPEICIELCYKDEDIVRLDSNGRRLFLNNEFHNKSRRHLKDTRITTTKTISAQLSIIDSEVFDEENKNIALSKSDFADNIVRGNDLFKGVDFSGFELFFELLCEVINIS